MKNLVLAVLACTMAVFTYAQKSDGIVYWSYEAGYHFDFDLDGKIDLTVPTQTKDGKHPIKYTLYFHKIENSISTLVKS